MASIPNPLRIPGLARIVAGGWIVAAGIATLRQFGDLQPQAARLFYGEMGKTDEPLRATIALAAAAGLVLTGLFVMWKGVCWLRRLPLPPGGPPPIGRDEAYATLVRREPPLFGEGPRPPYWLLRRLIPDQLADATWWRRDLMGRGVRAFLCACVLVMAIGVLFVWLPYLTYLDLVGRFPTTFVLVLLFVTGVWAALGLMLIPSEGPRIESFEFPLLAEPPRGPVIESAPEMLDRESPWLGVTLGVLGAAVQYLVALYWTIPTIGYPLLATSIIRHSGSIAGGIVFFAIGERLQASAADILLTFRHGSTLALVEAGVGHGALVRTESRGLEGARHLVSAAVSPVVREDVARLVESGAGRHNG